MNASHVRGQAIECVHRVLIRKANEVRWIEHQEQLRLVDGLEQCPEALETIYSRLDVEFLFEVACCSAKAPGRVNKRVPEPTRVWLWDEAQVELGDRGFAAFAVEFDERRQIPKVAFATIVVFHSNSDGASQLFRRRKIFQAWALRGAPRYFFRTTRALDVRTRLRGLAVEACASAVRL